MLLCGNIDFSTHKKSPGLEWRMAPKLKERRGKGIAVNVLALYSIDPNSNPAQVYRFYVKVLLEKNWKKNKKRPEFTQFLYG